MNSSRKKEIASLRNRLASLELEQEREEQASEALESAYTELLGRLQESDLDLDSFVRRYRKELTRILNKIERQEAKSSSAPSAPKASTKTKVVRKRRKKAKATIRIPAGSYHNIPPQSEQVFTVNEKGPRPKAVKAHAEALGLEAFLAQCRMEQ